MRRILALVLFSLLLSGCGQTSFVGKRFDNFTAYYNKFFNARKAFDAGLKAIEKENVRIERDRYLALFTNPDVVTSNTNFRDTIKKSADVLREHPSSKWVDDALLLIGKSYFYQQNYVGAEQKFLEVIGLKTGKEDEARFWLARTLIVSGSFEPALQHLIESLNRDGLSPRWEPMFRLALGELHVDRGEWEEAAEELSVGLQSVRDKDLGARAQFLLGQVYETMDAYEQAVAAYGNVEKFRPLYELSYAAALSAVRVKGMYINEAEALRELRRMDRDGKNYSYRNELAYIRARIYQANGHADDAFLLYDEILYDSDGEITRVRGPIHYALGELYRDYYQDFLTASAHFDTAATAISTASAPGTSGSGSGAARTGRAAAVRYAPEAISDARRQQEMFSSFSEVKLRIEDMDSLLHLGSLDEDEFEAAILRIRQQLAAEMEAQRRELQRREAAQAFSDAGAAEASRLSQTTDASQASGEAGFLYHRDPMLIEENRRSFVNIWGERQLVPNWRRRDAVDAYLAAAEGSDEEEDEVDNVNTAGGLSSLPVVDVSTIPRDSLSRVAMRAKRARASYELANVLFLGMNRPDSAAVWYRMVIRDANDSTLVQRAYYALAEVHRASGDVASANELYRTALEVTPTTELGRQVGRQLGVATPHESLSDTLARAEEAYDRAYRRWQRGSYRVALQDMLVLAHDYPSTPVAPRALMAAGTIYTEWAVRDSLELFAPLPISLSDSVLQDLGLRGGANTLAEQNEDALDSPVNAEALAYSEDPSESGRRFSGRERVAGERLDIENVVSPSGEHSDEVTDVPVVAEDLDSLQADVEYDANLDSDAGSRAPMLASLDDSLSSELDVAISDSLTDSLSSIQPTAEAESEPVTLEVLYASVQERYAESPFSERARRISAVLKERRDSLLEAAHAAADSAQAAADSALALQSHPDSLLDAGEVLDSLAVMAGDSVDKTIETERATIAPEDPSDEAATVPADQELKPEGDTPTDGDATTPAADVQDAAEPQPASSTEAVEGERLQEFDPADVGETNDDGDPHPAPLPPDERP